MISRTCLVSGEAAAASTAVARSGKITVNKFGGSSVGSANAIKAVGSILTDSLKAGDKPVGVLSAMLNVTNKLLAIKEAAIQGDLTKVNSLREQVWALHEKTASVLAQGSHQAELLDTLDGTLRQHLDATAHEILESGSASIYQSDVIVATGERLSNTILAGHLRSEGYLSEAFQADDVIVTDGISGGSMPLLDHTTAKVSRTVFPLLEAGGIPLVCGFFGASESGKITTLGRGGSDLTAATLGYCLDADEVSLFKVEHTENEHGELQHWDSGFVGVVHDADVSQTIRELDYEDARELAHFGKKVLHPETVSPAVEKNIPIFVKNTLEPNLAGTVIKRKPAPEHSSIVNALTKIPVAKYQDSHGVEVEAPEDSVLVAMVGENISLHGAELSTACANLLSEAGIDCQVPSHVNGSINNFSVAVPETHYKTAVKLLHSEFVDNPVSDVISKMSVGDAATAVANFKANVAQRARSQAFGGEHQQLQEATA